MFMTTSYPLTDPLSPTVEHIIAFVSLFSNGDTLGKYLGAVRLALRLARRPPLDDSEIVSGLLRGARKFRSREERPALREHQVLALVQAALDKGDTELGRIVAIARHFMLRVSDELFPLQSAGRSGIASDSLGWHSEVHLRRPPAAPDGPREATLLLRTRKNEQNSRRGVPVRRLCSCSREPLLCGPCALRGLLRSAEAAGLGPRERVLSSKPFPALCRLRTLCKQLGLPANLGWHAFRRGMARDMLASGATLSQLLRAGGWKSSAFLRYLCRRDVDAREATEFALADSDSELD